MKYNRPIVISIAGFDPSGGAGVLADIKTFEQNNCLGMAVVSALTVQTENQFISVNWLTAEKIVEQLKPLLQAYTCKVIKIGIIKDLPTLRTVVDSIHSIDQAIKIVWDTVLAASSGFNLLSDINTVELNELLKHIYLITPNTNEALQLSGEKEELVAARSLSAYCHILLKGGHSQITKGTDILFYDNKIFELKASAEKYYDKHGSGCILSSAIASGLATGKSLEQSCVEAKQYIKKVLNSNQELLAYHVQ